MVFSPDLKTMYVYSLLHHSWTGPSYLFLISVYFILLEDTLFDILTFTLSQFQTFFTFLCLKRPYINNIAVDFLSITEEFFDICFDISSFIVKTFHYFHKSFFKSLEFAFIFCSTYSFWFKFSKQLIWVWNFLWFIYHFYSLLLDVNDFYRFKFLMNER